MDNLFKECTPHHGPSTSKYPRKEVPRHLFLKNPEDPESGEYKTCYDCRQHKIKTRQLKKEEEKSKIEIIEKGFKKCGGDHPSVRSPYPKNRVPENLFLKDEKNPEKGFYKTCLHCREYRKESGRKAARIRNENKKLEKVGDEFRECVPSHKQSGSPYPRTKVPAHLFFKNPEDPTTKICRTCFDCRQHNQNFGEKCEDPEFKSCSYTHSDYNCPFPKDKVPLFLFLEDPEDLNSKEYKTCLYCREYLKKIKEKKENTILAIIQENEEIKRNNGDYLYCLSKHHLSSNSEYPREKVPLINFKKYPDDPESEFFTSCLDCRIYNIKMENNRIEKYRKVAEQKGLFFCPKCRKIYPHEERGVNIDNRKSAFCLSCKEKEKEKYEKQKENYNKLKYEMMQISQSSCNRCMKIYINPISNSLKVRELDTYVKNDIRYVVFEEVEYSVLDFLQKFENILAYKIIQFDHMTEEEQRKTGRLKENEEYIPKFKEIPKLTSEYSRRKELKKCQQLCIKCHIEIEMEREEKREKKVDKTGKMFKEKRKYVNNIKKEGCSHCGYKNENLSRFFDMDHIDPYDKNEIISAMVMQAKYSMENLIEECNKCRVLCKFCHAIHTDQQHEQKIFIKVFEDEDI